jgi:K+/H+ antiporter YhaU regulatory subunit KhtT
VRIAKRKEGMTLAYTTIGEKKVVVELKESKYKLFVFSTSHPEEIVNVIKNQLRR